MANSETWRKSEKGRAWLNEYNKKYYRQRLANDPEYKTYGRERNKLRRAKNPVYCASRRREYYAGKRNASFRVMGSKCLVNNCQANDDPEELRFEGLSIHHLDRQHYRKRKQKRASAIYEEILAGHIEGKQLLCDYHHSIADSMSKEKWLEWLATENAIQKEETLNGQRILG
jgi:hypothetical protein